MTSKNQHENINIIVNTYKIDLVLSLKKDTPGRGPSVIVACPKDKLFPVSIFCKFLCLSKEGVKHVCHLANFAKCQLEGSIFDIYLKSRYGGESILASPL